MKRTLLFISFLYLVATLSHAQRSTGSEKYQCLPCGQHCDEQKYDVPGKCMHCQMDLVKSSTLTFKTISPEEICDYVKKHPDAVLLDVRTKAEFEGKHDPDYGTLKNAINIPIGEIDARMNELTRYKEKEVIVFCSHSHRSPQVSYKLTQNGFKKVSNMSGGMSVMNSSSCKK
jgi:rhodanese-related sulfurtransferase